MYLAAAASVDVNGERVANLGRGQSYTGAVVSGPAIVTVSAWSAPGQSSYRFTVEPGKSYRLLVTPRGEPLAAGVAGAAVAGPFAGLATEAAEGGGPFQVAPANP